MGDVVGFSVAPSLSDDEDSRQGRGTGADMDYRTAGKVEDPQLLDPSARAPDPVGKRVVNERGPEDGEEEKGAELDPFREGPSDKGGRDDGEHALKNHEDRRRDGSTVMGVRAQSHSVEPHVGQVSDDTMDIGTEGETVAPKDPLQGDNSQNYKAVHDGPQNIFFPDHASIKQTQCRGHQHDKSGGDEYEECICRVQSVPPGDFWQGYSKARANDHKIDRILYDISKLRNNKWQEVWFQNPTNMSETGL